MLSLRLARSTGALLLAARHERTGCDNVPSLEGTLAQPGEYDWTYAFFGPPESTTQTANRSVQPFCTTHGRKSLYFTMDVPSPKIVHSHVTLFA